MGQWHSLQTDMQKMFKEYTRFIISFPQRYIGTAECRTTPLLKNGTCKKILCTRIYKLTEKEIKLADAICSKNGKKYGYNEYYKLNVINSFFLKLKHIIPIIKGYIDVYKDKLIYFAPIEMKLNRKNSKR